MNSLLTFTDRGIYCADADVYIDPWKKVSKAIITHGHSDHARWGHGAYLAHHTSGPVLKHRLGDVNLRLLEYEEPITINGIRFSLHPAGHIPGSAQVRVERKGEVWVASGDYKTEDDGISVPFEPVKCHTFITECTFGLPVFRWKKQEVVVNEINSWWKKNTETGLVSVLIAYSLGKAQRLIMNLDTDIGTIYTHGAVEQMNRVFRSMDIALPETQQVTKDLPKEAFRGALVVAPPSAIGSPWIRKFQPFSLGIASGWMALRGTRRRRAADRGFVLSDHADWEGLNQAIRETGAERVIATHGYTQIFVEWLKENGYEALSEQTAFEGESVDRDSVEELT
jgi:putative mRNA 3-end processing factor